jgi:hypothetical protein
MRFKIIGEITSVETFATGRGIPELSRLNFMVKGAGVKEKELPRFGSWMVQSGALSFIGMNRQVSERRNSR